MGILDLGNGSALPGVQYKPVDHPGVIHRRDAGTIFTTQDLEFLDTTIMEDDYQPMSGSDLVAGVSNVEGWRKTIRRKRRSVGGKPVWVGSGSQATQIPNVDQDVKATIWLQNKLAIAATWDDDELAGSQAMGLPIDTTSATDAVELLRTKMNQFKFSGEATLNMKGFFDDALVPRAESSFGFNANFTPTVIVTGMHNFVNEIANRTNSVERPNRLALTIDAWHYATSTAFSADNPRTIMEQFLATSPYITSESQVFPMVELNTINIGGTEYPTMVAYTFQPNKAQINEIPPMGLQVQRVGLVWMVIYVAYLSEVQHLKPKAASILYNINRTS